MKSLYRINSFMWRSGEERFILEYSHDGKYWCAWSDGASKSTQEEVIALYNKIIEQDNDVPKITYLN